MYDTSFVMDPASVTEMENSNPFKGTSTPGTPLHQLSPERINQLRMPPSPSLQSFLNENDRTRHRDSISSEVQAKVAFLNSLSAQSSPTRQPRTQGATPSHALQRALMGYEEATASLATLHAELDRAKTELAVGKKRERMISERIESLMEDLQSERQKRLHDRESFLKEIKKSRKETYKAELAQVEAREELKEARNELKRANAEVAHEKAEKEKARQEAFERAYALAGVMEEMEALKERLKAVEKDRDTAILEMHAGAVGAKEKTPMVEVGVQTVSKMMQDVGRRPQHKPKPSKQMDDADATPKASQRMAPRTPKPEIPLSRSAGEVALEPLLFHIEMWEKTLDGTEFTMEDQIQMLKQELRRATRQHAQDEEMIHFLHMQCQFKACPCRVAEAKGERFVHDYAYDAMMRQEQHAAKKRKFKEDERANQLPPEPTPEAVRSDGAEGATLEEAIEVPLPSPRPRELASRNTTPEPTAQLEEITQVLVETGPATKPFSFSTSTSNHARSTTVRPTLHHHTESESNSLENDLFDLSPPKQPPPRPSTAMGVLSLHSPIRLVPDSSRSSRIMQEAPPSTPPAEDGRQTMSRTTTVALKDSPVRQHRRAQSRPNIRPQSRGRSPLDSNTSDLTTSISGSPSSTTTFPVTPAAKHSRSHPNLAIHAKAPTATAATTTTTTMTTTTMIPLRGLDADDDVFSPQRTDSRTLQNSTEPIQAPGTPISREAALAQIRARRDRARSVNMKREAKSAPGSAVKRGVNLTLPLRGETLQQARERDFSQASAPGRFAV